ncbi:MAG: hypothetical protein ACI4JT_07735 [Oscillospiraceae bacterium]
MEVQKPFSSEKGFWSPKALERSVTTGAKRREIRFKSAKGVQGGKQEFSPLRKGVWGKPRGVSPKHFRRQSQRKCKRARKDEIEFFKYSRQRNSPKKPIMPQSVDFHKKRAKNTLLYFTTIDTLLQV